MVGGSVWDESDALTAMVRIYSPENDSWRNGTDFPMAQKLISVVEFGDTVLAIVPGASEDKFIKQYDVEADEWFDRDDLTIAAPGTDPKSAYYEAMKDSCAAPVV